MWRSLLTTALLIASSSTMISWVRAEKEESSSTSASTTTSLSSVASQEKDSHVSRATSSSCTLPCKNGGVCKIQQSPNAPVLASFPNLLQSNQSDTAQQVCDCSNTQYLGEYCDVRVQPCASTSTVVCLYGQKCEEDDDGFHCVCDPTITNSDGSSPCQHHKTQVCNVPGQPPGRAGNNYCVNDGVCNEEGGCRCPLGYGGPHCEYRGDKGLMDSSYTASALENSNGSGGRGNVAFVASMAVVAVVFALVGIILAGRIVRKQRAAARERNAAERTLLTSSGPHDRNKNNGNNVLIDLGHPQRDFDGNELEEVEII